MRRGERGLYFDVKTFENGVVLKTLARWCTTGHRAGKSLLVGEEEGGAVFFERNEKETLEISLYSAATGPVRLNRPVPEPDQLPQPTISLCVKPNVYFCFSCISLLIFCLSPPIHVICTPSLYIF